MMRDLYLIGAGGFSKEVLHLVEIIQKVQQQWNKVLIIDDNLELRNTEIRGKKIIGGLDFFDNLNVEVDVVITINKIDIREKIFNKLKNNKIINFPNLFSPFSIIDFDYLIIGRGNIIMHYVVLSAHLKIGDFNIINSYTGIGHDSKIGDFNSFGPRVAISGAVTIGKMNDFAVNCTVLQNKCIGNNNIIWMNTSVMRNLKDGNTYFGIPAKKINL